MSRTSSVSSRTSSSGAVSRASSGGAASGTSGSGSLSSSGTTTPLTSNGTNNTPTSTAATRGGGGALLAGAGGMPAVPLVPAPDAADARGEDQGSWAGAGAVCGCPPYPCCTGIDLQHIRVGELLYYPVYGARFSVEMARFSVEICTRGCHWIPRMFA
jgi:hypothetical protein